MAMNTDGSLVFGTEVDQSGLKSGLNESEGIVSKQSGKMSSLAKGMFLGATTAIAAGFGAAATAGIKYNMQMETYLTNFKVMLGDEAAAVAKVAELRTMAAKTPFGMEDLASATQTLLAFQVPADKTTDILQMLGDVSLGNKEKLAGLAVVFGQVSSAGKLQGQDLLQMINQGFNPLNYISKRTGESMEQLRDRMSKGAVTAEEVTQAFKDATSEGGQFYKGMEEGSKTTEGLISTLKDEVLNKLGSAFEVVNAKIKEILPSVIAFVSNLNVEGMANAIIATATAFANLAPYILAAVSALTAYKLATGAIALYNAVLAGTTKAQIALNAVMAANPIVLVITLLAGLVAAFLYFWNTSESFRKFWIGLWESVRNSVSSFIAWFAGLPAYFVQIGANIVQGLWNGIKSSWAWLVESIKGLTKLLPKAVRDVLGIASPSKVFKQLGAWTAEGFTIGYEMKDPLKAIQASLVNGVNGTAQAASTSNISNSQSITFNYPVQAPDEIARALRIQNRYGLAGAL